MISKLKSLSIKFKNFSTSFNNDEIFLGREMAVSRDYSDEKSKIIDEEITTFIRDAEDFADKTLNKNIEQLHSLAKALLDYETITGEEMKIVLNGKEINRQIESKDNNNKEIKIEEKEVIDEPELKPATSAI